jgi:hypothetical protein
MDQNGVRHPVVPIPPRKLVLTALVTKIILLGHDSILLSICYGDKGGIWCHHFSTGEKICQEISHILNLNLFPTDVGNYTHCSVSPRLKLKQEAFESELITLSLEQERMCL